MASDTSYNSGVPNTSWVEPSRLASTFDIVALKAKAARNDRLTLNHFIIESSGIARWLPPSSLDAP